MSIWCGWNKFEKELLDMKLSSHRDRLEKLEYLINVTEELFVLLLLSRSVITDSEYRALIKALPKPRNMEAGTKHYTSEEKWKLQGIIDRLVDNPNLATWDDVFEMERIHNLIWNEYLEGRLNRTSAQSNNLRNQAKWVKMVVLITKAYLVSRGRNNF
jgi:hypothetical protein